MGLLKRIINAFKGENTSSSEVKERNVYNLKSGDIVTYDLEDYEVVGTITYNDSGYKWYAYQLVSLNKTIWLSAEMDDELELGIYEKLSFPLNQPIPKEVTVEEKTYYLDEKGKAYVSGTGRSQNISNRQMSYYDFADEDESTFLSVEVWGEEVEVSRGYPIQEFELKILAGS
ncbi:DUF4178 domain-containing protein [Bacillaceae bacterium SIJ1]|uniref:DUF4178 domain-containing protein n=1 Tax=Litoribacterium kuwaitense TaxID=1398745 RepID=UPI0013E9FC03|nr:DUF4178 domain-containing protein [Litoribacterium kuwaitense]NGP45045.1 DUF4178 domain-containing protein [Litoribacterium kuwaitense]